ncbi:MAG: histidine phosphatase family protein [Janthinobacterium lividum]
MANRILLLCAAATVGLRQGRFPAGGALETSDAFGAFDTPDTPDTLDRHGRAAIAAARTRLAALPWTQGTAFSSPAAAALQTAVALGHVPRVDAALRDTDYGQWGGRSLKDIARTDPEHLQAWLTDDAVAPPAGESFVQVLARVDAWLEAMLAAAANATARDAAPASADVPATAFAQASVIAVTHPTVMRAAALRGGGMSPGPATRMDIAPLSVMALERRCDAWACARPQAHPPCNRVNMNEATRFAASFPSNTGCSS